MDAGFGVFRHRDFKLGFLLGSLRNEGAKIEAWPCYPLFFRYVGDADYLARQARGIKERLRVREVSTV